MATVLHIQSSPRADSYSTRAAREFLDSYRRSHPGDQVELLDLWSTDRVFEFDAPASAAKYAAMGGAKTADPAAVEKWRQVIAAIDHFKKFDKFVISAPMWNFGVPYKLKNYVDILTQPGLTFRIDQATGAYVGLVTGKPALLVLARGGEYPPGTPMFSYDMQKPYLEMILKFIGFTDVRCLTVDQTLAGPEASAASARKAAEQARAMAGKF